MKKIKILSLFCLICVLKLSAQLNTFNKQFIYPYKFLYPSNAGNELNNINQTTDRGYNTCRGIIDSVNAVGYVYCELVKADRTGKPVWVKRILNGELQNAKITGNNVLQTHDKGYFAVTENLTATTEEIIAVKTDSLGNLKWSKKYAGEGSSIAYSAKQTADKGYIICGATTDLNHKQYAYIFKLDSVGNYAWGQKCLGSTDTLATFYTVVELPGHGYAAGGYSNSCAITVKFDLNGNMLWSTNLFKKDAVFYSLINTSDNALVLSGSFKDTVNSQERLCFVKIDQLGTVVWFKGYTQTSSMYYNSVAWAVKEMPNAFVFSGYIMDPIPGVLIGKLDLNGNYIWCKEYRSTMHPFSNTPLSITTTTDGGFALSGLVGIFYKGAARHCTQLLKTDAAGFVACDGINYPVPITNLSYTTTSTMLHAASGSAANYSAVLSNSTVLDTINCENINDPADGILDLSVLSFSLSQNYPNPFTNETSINYTLTEKAVSVLVEIYNMMGEKVMEQKQNKTGMGTHSIQLDAINLAQGIYLYSLVVEGKRVTRKMIVE